MLPFDPKEYDRTLADLSDGTLDDTFGTGGVVAPTQEIFAADIDLEFDDVRKRSGEKDAARGVHHDARRREVFGGRHARQGNV